MSCFTLRAIHAALAKVGKCRSIRHCCSLFAPERFLATEVIYPLEFRLGLRFVNGTRAPRAIFASAGAF
jgi:hypothetical protein